MPLLMLLLLACEPAEESAAPATQEPVEPPITPLVVSCVDDGNSFQEFGSVGAPGHWYGVVGRVGTAPSIGVTRDGGQTWDRLPIFAGTRPVLVGDSIIVSGQSGAATSGPDGRRVIGPDRQPAALEFVYEPNPGLPGGSEIAKPHDDLWVAITLEGLYRYSTDQGASWRSSPEGFERTGVLRLQASRGDRALLEAAVPSDVLGYPAVALSYTVNGGLGWEPLAGAATVWGPDHTLRRVALTGEAGIVLVLGRSDAWFLAISPDHGENWHIIPAHDELNTYVGPGDGEVWIQETTGIVKRTTDYGATYTRHTLDVGGPALEVSSLDGVVQDTDGRPVLHVLARDEQASMELRCTVLEAGAGALRRHVPERRDTAGTLTLWVDGGPVPMLEPGVLGQPVGFPNPAGLGYHERIEHITRTVDGNLKLLLLPPNGVSLAGGPPLEVWELEGVDGTSVVAKDAFDNLRERKGALNQPVPYYLEGIFFQVLPDGRIMVETRNGQGNYDMTKAPGEQPGYGGYRGRWGDHDGDYAYVATGSPSDTFYGGWLWRERGVNPPDCLGENPDVEDCFLFDRGQIKDLAIHQGALWVLDGLNGTLWRHDMNATVGDWIPAATGLLEATQLFSDMNPDDPGLFILEQSRWWRVVPGSGAARKEAL